MDQVKKSHVGTTEDSFEEEEFIIVLLDMQARFPYASPKHHRVLKGRMIGIKH